LGNQLDESGEQCVGLLVRLESLTATILQRHAGDSMSKQVWFAVGPIAILDRLGGPLDDAIAMWNVRAARRAAWTNAEVMWGLGAIPPLRDRFFRRLDSLVGMSGKGLLMTLERVVQNRLGQRGDRRLAEIGDHATKRLAD
jgi:hypothetical protein